MAPLAALLLALICLQPPVLGRFARPWRGGGWRRPGLTSPSAAVVPSVPRCRMVTEEKVMCEVKTKEGCEVLCSMKQVPTDCREVKVEECDTEHELVCGRGKKEEEGRKRRSPIEDPAAVSLGALELVLKLNEWEVQNLKLKKAAIIDALPVLASVSEGIWSPDRLTRKRRSAVHVVPWSSVSKLLELTKAAAVKKAAAATKATAGITKATAAVTKAAAALKATAGITKAAAATKATAGITKAAAVTALPGRTGGLDSDPGLQTCFKIPRTVCPAPGPSSDTCRTLQQTVCAVSWRSTGAAEIPEDCEMLPAAQQCQERRTVQCGGMTVGEVCQPPAAPGCKVPETELCSTVLVRREVCE